jgi:hypothetical protein|tara:strand:+ start:1282 stop:1581 length:300 start_codon:yes stop_codon:yes gene_type:complete
MPMISSLLNTIALQAKPKGILAQKKSGQSLTQRNYVKSESELSFPNLKNILNAEKYTFEVNASKTKTRKSASKRYKVTPSGKVSSPVKSQISYLKKTRD